MKTGQLNNQLKNGRRWLLLSLAAFATLFATAQQPVQLNLKDALTYALEANQNARKAKLDVENSEYQIDEVRSQALPQISGTGGLTYNPLLQKSALPNIFGANPNPNETILVAFGQKWNANAGVSLSQNLFNKSVFTGLDAAKAAREFYKISQQLTEEQVLEQVATNYYQVLVQRQQIGVIDSTIKNTGRVQRILEGQYKAGLAKKIDVDRIAVNISNLQSQRQQLLNGVSLLENQLKFFMGMPINTAIIIPDAEIQAIQPQAVGMNEAINVDDRTEVRLLRQQEDLLNFQKESIKAEYYPSLSLASNYSYQGIGNSVPLFKGKSSGVNWVDAASVSLNLRIPIFNGGATKSRIKQTEISIKKLNEDIANTSLGLNLAFENAKTQINNSIVTLNAQKKNVQLAQDVYSNTQNNYNNGLATLTDLLNAETSLTEANNNYSSALLNYRVAEIQLIKSQGQLKSLIN
ncbi:MAG: TolC family protein [Chitinophagaceae bacterium]|nr:MAG: TolC family protein [Chitinophagaceae bacterium]